MLLGRYLEHLIKEKPRQGESTIEISTRRNLSKGKLIYGITLLGRNTCKEQLNQGGTPTGKGPKEGTSPQEGKRETIIET